MRFLAILLFALSIIAPALAQEYSPRAGETVMKLAVEGRGNIFIRLNTREAPRTTAHIIRLVRSGFYDSQRFHKVVRSPRPFLVQVGDPASRRDVNSPEIGGGGSGTRIQYESNSLSNDEEGVVGLANPNDRNAGDSQFYMLLAPSKFLDGSYTVFGKVVGGIGVLRKIEKGDRIESASIIGG